MLSDIDEDYERCGKRIHYFWDDHVGDLLSYLRTSTVVQQSRGDSPQRESVRFAIHIEQSDSNEMET